MKEKILKATHAGELKVGDIVIPCAVLEDGTRVLSRAGFLRAIGRRGNAKTGPDYDDFKLPVFLVANNLKSFISADLLTASKPIRYKPQTGAPMALGYRADILPLVCNVFLEASDAKALTQHQTHIAE
ncbi:MAG: P63C domain-containing protein, partial [Blastocatellia bacterium]